MPKFYCEYCGIYLTHSSPSGRKQHSHGRKHIQNKIEYYSAFMLEHCQNINQQKMQQNPMMLKNSLNLGQNPLLSNQNRQLGIPSQGPTGYSYVTHSMTQAPKII